MPVVSLNVKRELSRVIKHFKFEELEASVLPIFPEISWSRIKTKLIKQHQNFSVGNVSKIIERAVDEHRIEEKFLKERLSKLEVIDISRHHARKTWYCYELKGSIREMNFMTKREIENKITEFFLLQHVQVEVQVTSNDGITFAALKVQPNGKKSVRVTPVYFALLLGQKYFFCSKKTVASDFTKAIANTMGYNGSKRVKLFGKNLPSLIKLIWQKKQGVINAKTVDVPYQDSKPVIKSTGIDYTQNKNRREYMEKCFGEEPPTLEKLVLDSADQTWKEEDTFAKLPDKKIVIGWEFGSHNVTHFLKHLAEHNMLVTPIPFYLSQWMTTGRNELTVKEN